MKIAITGASGSIGSVIRKGLRDQYGLHLIDQVPVVDLQPNEAFTLTDIRDLERLKESFLGCDTIIHLAGIPDESGFYAIAEANIIGTYSVFEAARRAKVKRLVFASSNHVVGFHQHKHQLDLEAPLRPDTYYGVSKVFGEAMGRLYHDKWGLEVLCLRIGSFREKPEDTRQLSTWLGYEDAVHLFKRAIEAEGIGYSVIYGVSANDNARWSNGKAAEMLGFQPSQNAEHYRAVVQRAATENDSHAITFHGGAFTGTNYRGT